MFLLTVMIYEKSTRGKILVNKAEPIDEDCDFTYLSLIEHAMKADASHYLFHLDDIVEAKTLAGRNILGVLNFNIASTLTSLLNPGEQPQLRVVINRSSADIVVGRDGNERRNAMSHLMESRENHVPDASRLKYLKSEWKKEIVDAYLKGYHEASDKRDFLENNTGPNISQQIRQRVSDFLREHQIGYPHEEDKKKMESVMTRAISILGYAQKHRSVLDDRKRDLFDDPLFVAIESCVVTQKKKTNKRGAIVEKTSVEKLSNIINDCGSFSSLFPTWMIQDLGGGRQVAGPILKPIRSLRTACKRYKDKLVQMRKRVGENVVPRTTSPDEENSDSIWRCSKK